MYQAEQEEGHKPAVAIPANDEFTPPDEGDFGEEQGMLEEMSDTAVAPRSPAKKSKRKAPPVVAVVGKKAAKDPWMA